MIVGQFYGRFTDCINVFSNVKSRSTLRSDSFVIHRQKLHFRMDLGVWVATFYGVWGPCLPTGRSFTVKDRHRKREWTFSVLLGPLSPAVRTSLRGCSTGVMHGQGLRHNETRAKGLRPDTKEVVQIELRTVRHKELSVVGSLRTVRVLFT